MKKQIKKLTAAALCAALALSTAITTQAAQADYADVAPEAWYAEAVGYCLDNGLMVGTGEARFSPDAPMTRAMLCMVLYRMAGSPQADPAGFTDVPAGAWYEAAVDWAAAAGLVTGYGDGRFGPADRLNREQLAAILWRWKGSPAVEREQSYDDGGDISAWARTAVAWARSEGLMSGVGGNLFRPGANATRAQAAKVLMEYTLIPGTCSVVSALDALCRPAGIYPSSERGFLVTDAYRKVVWQVERGRSTVYAGAFTPADAWGEPVGGYNDAALADSTFLSPWAVVPFLNGWAVSDEANGAVRLLTEGGVQTLNGTTKENIPTGEMGVIFRRPTGLASDGEGNLYISDTAAGAVRKITPEGAVTTLIGGLSEPMGLCWLDGSLYVAETGGNRILRVLPNGTWSAVGTGDAGFADGPAGTARFSGPQGLAAGKDGMLYIADTANSAIRCLKDGQVTTLISRDIAQTNTFFPVSPQGMMVQGRRLFVCDRFSCKVAAIALG